MNTREGRIGVVSAYLHQHFPAANIAVKTDGLTASAVFTVNERGVARHVEVPKRWLDQPDTGSALLRVIHEWGLAREIRSLDSSSTVRVGASGFEQVG